MIFVSSCKELTVFPWGRFGRCSWCDSPWLGFPLMVVGILWLKQVETGIRILDIFLAGRGASGCGKWLYRLSAAIYWRFGICASRRCRRYEASLVFAIKDWPTVPSRSNDAHLFEKCTLIPSNTDIVDFALLIEMDGMILVVRHC